MSEGQLVCGSHSTQTDAAENGTVNHSDEGNEQDVNALIGAPDIHASRFTWRMPAWVAFSWSSVRHRPHHHAVKRQPNPFHPQQPFSPLPSASPVSAVPPTDTTKAIYNPSAINYRWPTAPTTDSEMNAAEKPPVALPSTPDDDSKPVAVHPPPVSWDDQTTVDLPYDNPFYTRAISNVLWLPRDPIGTLNLDDTIDLKSSLTVDINAPPLGSWTGPLSQQASAMSIVSSPEEEFPPETRESVDGTESIDLPPTIAKRAEANDDVEHLRPHRSSSFRSRVGSGLSTAGGSSTTSGSFRLRPPPRRPSTGRPPPLSYRSFSEGTAPVPVRQKSSSFSSMFEPTPQPQPATSQQETGIRPDAHAQADFVAAQSSSSRLSLDKPRLKRARNISAHHAIVQEVVAEEQDAYEHRVHEEAAEAEKATTTRSWLTSWMFQRPTASSSSALTNADKQAT